MKKIFAILIAMVLACSLFAETYKIKSIIGSVTYETAPGKFDKLKEGMEIDGFQVVNTGLNSSIVVEHDGKTYTIKAKQKGSIEKLFVMAAPSKAGLKVQTIAKATAVDNATGKREGVSTASARASEAKEDLVWEE